MQKNYSFSPFSQLIFVTSSKSRNIVLYPQLHPADKLQYNIKIEIFICNSNYSRYKLAQTMDNCKKNIFPRSRFFTYYYECNALAELYICCVIKSGDRVLRSVILFSAMRQWAINKYVWLEVYISRESLQITALLCRYRLAIIHT